MAAEESFRQAIRAQRERWGITQDQLAEEMNRRGFAWNTTKASRTETGGRPVLLAEAVAVAEIFGVTLGEMLSERAVPLDAALQAARQRGFDECAAQVLAAVERAR